MHDSLEMLRVEACTIPGLLPVRWGSARSACRWRVRLSLALKHATRSSLVLLDEFGQGTRAADGVALLGAAIEHFCRWRQGPKARRRGEGEELDDG